MSDILNSLNDVALASQILSDSILNVQPLPNNAEARTRKLSISKLWHPEQTPQQVSQSVAARKERLGEIDLADWMWDPSPEAQKRRKNEYDSFLQHVNDQICDITWGWSEDGQVHCFIEARNGQSVIGTAICKTAEEFHAGVGHQESKERAFNQLYRMEQYVQATERLRERQARPK